MQTVNPMLAQTAKEPFDDPARMFDLKYNGMRIVGHVGNGSALLQGRSGADFTAQFPELADLAKSIKTWTAMVDGEVVCLGEDGLPDFNALQNRHGKQDPLAIQAMMKRYPAQYHIFDLVAVDEFDLTAGASAQATLMQRREILERLLISSDSIRLSPWVDGKGTALMEQVLAINDKAGRQVFDGVMAKTKSGLYHPGGRGDGWQKVKIPRWGNFVICGYTLGTGWREDMMGAVVLGTPENGGLRWVGCAGSGLKMKQLQDLHQTLVRMNTAQRPFDPGTKVPKLDSWVRPELVVEVKYYDVTKNGQLIWPIFQRLRPDLRVEDLVEEVS